MLNPSEEELYQFRLLSKQRRRWAKSGTWTTKKVPSTGRPLLQDVTFAEGSYNTVNPGWTDWKKPLGQGMVRLGMTILLVPDPIPLVDEAVGLGLILVGGTILASD